MNLYVDIDNTICTTPLQGQYKYEKAVPLYERIAEINQLYDISYLYCLCKLCKVYMHIV